MLSGGWSEAVDPSQGRGDTLVTASIVAPVYACVKSLMKEKPPEYIYNRLQKYF